MCTKQEKEFESSFLSRFILGNNFYAFISLIVFHILEQSVNFDLLSVFGFEAG